MTTTAAAPTTPETEAREPLAPLSRRVRRGWILEILVLAVLYFVYDALRDKVAGSATAALHHARQIIRLERDLGLLQERRVQQWVLPNHPAISFFNIWYGTIHFVMPVVALVVLYRSAPARYVRWRNTLILLSLIGLLGFWLWPLTPPRLMPSHQWVDTPAQFFNFGPQAKGNSTKAFGNLYAAMPSLHGGWSLFSTLALLPMTRRWWLRALLMAYPVTILFTIVVTGNHWILDAVGGWIALLIAYVLACAWERLVYRRPVRFRQPVVRRSRGVPIEVVADGP
ncbi:MAG: rane protein [Actinomycetia bacterium]|nr:rane protein [Actinomycetes bacterium]